MNSRVQMKSTPSNGASTSVTCDGEKIFYLPAEVQIKITPGYAINRGIECA